MKISWFNSGGLKFYLPQQALPSSGTHSDLAAPALVAFEQQIPIKESAKDCAKILTTEYDQLLQKYGLQQDPQDMTDWEDLTKWPRQTFHISSVTF